ncbi:MAG: hypothetical protein QOH29_409 [Actinomycetota bacterium]|nr:hypothetical protein [Actinomycetota bacterium]
MPEQTTVRVHKESTTNASKADGYSDDSVGDRDVDRATGSAVRSGLAWTLGGQWAGYALQIVTTAVLARLVAPKDFGLLSEALTVTAFATQMQTLGLSQAVVQRAKLTHGQLSNLFWVNAGAGVVLALLVVASAPLVAGFYGNHALIGVVAALAVSYVIAGLGVQHAALMSRRMKFRAIAVRSFVPRLLAGVAAIVAALLGAGYWALVIQQIVGVFFFVVFVWTAIDWRPSRPTRGTGVRPLLRFGAGVSIANILYYFSSNADTILVGRVLGTGPLGLYARAYNLFLVPLRQIHGPLGNVVQPVMSAIVGEPERYRAFYRRMLGAITMVGMPGVVFLAVMSREIIVVVLGHRWVGAAEPFRWLAVAGFLQMVSRTFTWLFTTSGRSRAMAIWAGVSAPVAVASFVVGLHWGITGVATAYAIVQTGLILPGIWFAVRGTPVRMSDVADAVWRSAVVAGVVGGAATVVRLALAGAPAFTILLAGMAAAALCWACIVLRWPALRADLLAVKGTLTRRNAR